jgi:hypothetical protein
MNIHLAQSLPKEGPVIQRTIEDEADIQTQTTRSSDTQASSSVLFGLAAIILVIIAIGAFVLLMGKSSKNPPPQV